MKTTTKKYLRLSVILYLVLLATIAVVSFGWFVLERHVALETDQDFTITAGSRLEICLPVEGETDQWGSVVTMDALKTQSFPDITGDGTHFYYPKSLDTADEPFLNDPATFVTITEENASAYLLTFKLKFRTNAQMDVYLSNQSKVEGKNYNPLDAIAGAVRVSFSELNQADEEELKCVWIPNEGYQYTADGNIFNDNGTYESSYGYLQPDNYESSNYAINDQTSSMVPVSYKVEQFYNGRVMVGTSSLASPPIGSGETAIPMVNSSTSLLHFDNSNTLVEKTLVIRVWVEGTDREAHTMLNGGKFKFKLDFAGIDKDKPTDNPLEGTTYSKGKLWDSSNQQITGGILYSYDGIHWTTYQADGHPGFDDVPTGVLFIKTQETADLQSSDVVVVDLTAGIEPIDPYAPLYPDWTSYRQVGEFDTFTVDGDIMYFGVNMIETWHATASGPFVNVNRSQRVGLYGWLTGTSPLTQVGYCWDDDPTITWQDDMGAYSEQEVLEHNGIRYHIQVPMSEAPSTGEHIVRFVGKLENGTEVEFERLKINLSADTIPDSPDGVGVVVDWSDRKQSGSLDAFTFNGNIDPAAAINISQWNAASGNHVNIDAQSTAGLYGWAAFNSQLTWVGYYWDDETSSIIWQRDFGVETGSDVIAAGGEKARRFHINAAMLSAPSLGRHTLHYVGRLANGRIVEFESWVMNISTSYPRPTTPPTLVAPVTVVNWSTKKTAGSLDGFTINGNYFAPYPVASWNVASGQVVDTYTSYSSGLYGWAAFSSALTKVGYYWGDTADTSTITWQADLGGIASEPGVTSQGGVRFHINTPINTAPDFGKHTIHYVGLLADGTVVEFESWVMNILW